MPARANSREAAPSRLSWAGHVRRPAAARAARRSGRGRPGAPARKPRPRRDRRPRRGVPPARLRDGRCPGSDREPRGSRSTCRRPTSCGRGSPTSVCATGRACGRRLSALGKDRDAARRAQTLTPDRRRRRERRAPHRRAACERADDHLPRPARQRSPRRHRRGDPRPPGGGRRRRDGQRQDDAAAEDPARARPRHQRADRAHAAAPHRRARRRRPRRGGARRRARRRRRLPGALHRPLERAHARQGDDRRHPARRDRSTTGCSSATTRSSSTRRTSGRSPSTSSSATSRRSCRGAPTSRSSSPRPPSTPRASPSTSTTRRSSRSAAAPTRSRCATRRTASRTATTATRSRRSATPSPSCSTRAPATSSCSSPASARSATRPRRCKGLSLKGTEILPLYGRLSAAEQHQVFEAHSGRRVVLATNVAETSPDRAGHPVRHRPGHRAHLALLARGSKMQRLPIEAISQASRLPALGPLRPRRRRHRHPPLLRGRLPRAARVHRAGDPAHQPRLGHPADDLARARRRRGVPVRRAAGLAAASRTASTCCASWARCSPDATCASPRSARGSRGCRSTRASARMVLEAEKQGCVAEVLVIASALSIQDPRERPTDKQAQADQQHARFVDPTSDFLSFLGLWSYLREQQEARSGNQFRRMCRDEYLHYLRDPRVAGRALAAARRRARTSASRSVASALPRRGADPAAVHRALIAGLLSHVGSYDQARRDYLGARGARWAIHPGLGALAQAAGVRDGGRAGGDLAGCSAAWPRASTPRRSRRSPATSCSAATPSRAGRRSARAVVADERVTLYGVPLVAGRRVQYGRIDPVVSRDLFIRHALVDGEWDTPPPLRARQRAAGRRRSPSSRTACAAATCWSTTRCSSSSSTSACPRASATAAAFDRWWKGARRETPDLLTYPRELLVREAGDDLDEAFPRRWSFGLLRHRAAARVRASSRGAATTA